MGNFEKNQDRNPNTTSLYCIQKYKTDQRGNFVPHPLKATLDNFPFYDQKTKSDLYGSLNKCDKQVQFLLMLHIDY